MNLIERMKLEFPNPMSSQDNDAVYNDNDPRAYCVGGAVCLTADMSSYFPDEHSLMQALQYLNDELTKAAALVFALRIINQNDRKDFEAAWATATEALAWRNPDVTD